MVAGALLGLAPAAVQGSAPDEELLEFLADWEDSDGQWLDPLELDAYAIDDGNDDDERTENDGDDEN